MTVLTANVDASTDTFPVDDGSGIERSQWYQVDDELVEFVNYGQIRVGRADWTQDMTKLLVNRGKAGTTAASHLSGATLTPYEPDAPSLGGAEQSISLLGPYSVSFDDEGVGSMDVVIGDLSAYEGAYVVRAWMLTPTDWTRNAGTTFSWFISLRSGLITVAIASYNDHTAPSDTAAEPEAADTSGAGALSRVARIKADTDLMFQAYAGGSAITGGVADVYLLIVTPA